MAVANSSTDIAPGGMCGPSGQETVEGDECIFGFPAHVNVLTAFCDVPGSFMGLEHPRMPNLVRVQVLSAVQGQDVPWTYLGDLLKIHVASRAQQVANLGHPSCPTLREVVTNTSLGLGLKLWPCFTLRSECMPLLRRPMSSSGVSSASSSAPA
eukprot:CAMPEP_0115192600 /NCGR_PEP_ID=MMETSP0270-20121206/13124_1 /TAXON_ID=71861 /ORGANISM="Scrippsiella trochoidea, Strain CCMP3099" /LENGTH=153 /DNA_ID=CAMNT_0002605847 /DNA_START=486 /DNA_END=945 /DNA_ORIENTATION=-